MRTTAALALLVLTGCVTDTEPPGLVPVWRERWLRAHAPEPAPVFEVAPSSAPAVPPEAAELSRSEPRAELRGLLALDDAALARLETLSADDVATAGAFDEGLTARDFVALVWLRSPAVRAARDAVEARRTRHEQASHLAATVLAYQRYQIELVTRVGPGAGARDPEGEHHPTPAVLAVTGERIRHDVDAASHALRNQVRTLVSTAYRAISEAHWLEHQIEIAREQIALFERLAPTVENRVSVNLGSLGDLLAVQAEVLRLATQVENLESRRRASRAHLRSLLQLDNAPWPSAGHVDLPDLAGFVPSDERREGARGALLAVHAEIAQRRAELERMRATRRLLELATLPRPGLDTARPSRTSSGETSIEGRERAFQPTIRIQSLPFFGVREAALREARAREREMAHRLEELETRALDAFDQAWQNSAETRRWSRLLDERLVSLAREAYDAVLGAYDGNRARFLDVLQAARRVLDVRLEAARREHESTVAFAALVAALGADPRLLREESPR